MNVPTQAEGNRIREALQQLPTEALQRGMAAFTHPPHMSWQPVPGDVAGCFMWEAIYKTAAVTGDGKVDFVVKAADRPAILALSGAYEYNTDWLKGECLRELAERGGAPEPAAREEAVATC